MSDIPETPMTETSSKAQETLDFKEQFRGVFERLDAIEQRRISQSSVPPQTIKSRHLEDGIELNTPIINGNISLSSPTITSGLLYSSTLYAPTVTSSTGATGTTASMSMFYTNGVLRSGNPIGGGGTDAIQLYNAGGGGSALVSVGASNSVIINGTLSGTAGFDSWTSFIPTTNNFTIGNGTLSSAYAKIGKTVHWRFQLSFGTTTSVGTNPTFSLPVKSKTGGFAIFPVTFLRQGVAFFICAGFLTSTTSFQIYGLNIDGGSGNLKFGSAISATFPATWANTDSWEWYITYESE